MTETPAPTTTATPELLGCTECAAGYYRAEPYYDGKWHVYPCTNDHCEGGVTMGDFDLDPGNRIVQADAPGYGQVLAVVTDWYVVIERESIEGTPMVPVVIGPYSEADADEECQSDSGIVFSLLTIDCLNEGWIGDDVYVVTGLPDGAPDLIHPVTETVEG